MFNLPKTVEVSWEYLKDLRKAVGLQIDPETTDIMWKYAQTLDPYGDHDSLPDECRQVGREYFARNRASDLWIAFGDLPKATRQVLWTRLECGTIPMDYYDDLLFLTDPRFT